MKERAIDDPHLGLGGWRARRRIAIGTFVKSSDTGAGDDDRDRTFRAWMTRWRHTPQELEGNAGKPRSDDRRPAATRAAPDGRSSMRSGRSIWFFAATEIRSRQQVGQSGAARHLHLEAGLPVRPSTASCRWTNDARATGFGTASSRHGSGRKSESRG
ncbi:MAG: hypothetical protein H6893_10345 [Brucellaceae bacterium]|nr:hypothetical protein [Brucellaceae bacterium]